MDPASIGAVTAVWHTDLNEAERWFEVIGQAFAGLESIDWAAFRPLLERHAGEAGFSSETVQAFATYVDDYLSDPVLVIGELADPGNASEVLQLYESGLEQALLAARQVDVDEADHPRRLLWVTDAQMAQLETLAETRGDWTDWLPLQLDEWWPDWTSARPADLVPWLDEWLPALAPEAAPDPRELRWVTADQAGRLEKVSTGRGHWTEWLPTQLDEWWADWPSASDQELTPWLDEWLPTLTPAEAFDARDLGWVHESQVDELEAYASTRGDWRDWLPEQLDEWWPEWPTADSETLIPWLTECLAVLAEYDQPATDDVTSASTADVDPTATTSVTADPEPTADPLPYIEPLTDEDLDAERPDTEVNAQAIADGVLEAVVGQAALDLDEFSELSDEQFTDLLGEVLESEIDTRAPDTAL